jgi:TRAP-type C4-dicarboxylate transport system substrate-binding protein
MDMIKKMLLVLGLMLMSSAVLSATFKVGVLAPEGTAWAKSLKKMVEEIDKATEGEVKFKIFFGGSQGDEPDVLRKVRIGQLHGGIFTGKTLGDINGDVRVMELPFTFYSDREKALKTLKNLTPFFNKGFEKNQFVNLGFFELGVVYFQPEKDRYIDQPQRDENLVVGR